MAPSPSPGSSAASHRFVLVYRSESREIEGAATIWRGWVQRVPNPRQREMEMQSDDRMDFRDLSEVPKLIELLIARADGALPDGAEDTSADEPTPPRRRRP